MSESNRQLLNLVAIVTALGSGAFALALGTHIVGAMIGTLFAYGGMKGCFWVLERLDRR